MVSYGIQDMDEGERLMREGKIMAIVQIPAFFEKNILSNSQTHIETYISGTNITVNGLLSKDIQTAVTTFRAASRSSCSPNRDSPSCRPWRS